VLLCHGAPVRIEEFEYIFAPEQGAGMFADFRQLGDITLSGTVTVPRLFALKPGEVREMPAKSFALAGRLQVNRDVWGRWGRPRDYDNGRATRSTTRRRSTSSIKRVEYDIDMAANEDL